MEEVCIALPVLAQELQVQGYSVSCDGTRMRVSDSLWPLKHAVVYSRGGSKVGCTKFIWVDLYEPDSIETFMRILSQCLRTWPCQGDCDNLFIE